MNARLLCTRPERARATKKKQVSAIRKRPEEADSGLGSVRCTLSTVPESPLGSPYFQRPSRVGPGYAAPGAELSRLARVQRDCSTRVTPRCLQPNNWRPHATANSIGWQSATGVMPPIPAWQCALHSARIAAQWWAASSYLFPAPFARGGRQGVRSYRFGAPLQEDDGPSSRA